MSKSKDASAEKSVLDYLKAQNRPYSATDIFNNIHKEYGKTVVVRALEQLAQDNKIREKTYGKQKIYFANQNEFSEASESELAAMDEEIVTLEEKLQAVNQKLQTQQSALNSLTNSLTTEEVVEKIKATRDECDKLQAKLDALTSNTKMVDPEVREQIYSENAKYVKEWRKRKRMANDILEAILEGYPKGKKALLEETSVETDEDANVALPK